MKKFFTFLLVFLFCFLTACKSDNTKTVISISPARLTANERTTVQYNAVEAFYSDVILYQSGSEIGVLNNDGSIRLKAQYSGLKPISPDYLMFETGDSNNGFNSIGLISANGEEILPCKYGYIEYIDEEYVLLTTYEKTETEELIAGWLKDVNGDIYAAKFEIYSLKDRQKSNIDLSDYIYIQDISAVENSFQICQSNGDTDSSIEIYDKKSGEHKCSCSLWYLNGQYYYGIDDGRVVNADGEYVSNDNIWTYTNSKVDKNDLAPCIKDNRLGYADNSGNMIINYEYDNLNEAYVFGENNIIPVCKNGYWGFIDKSGNLLCNFIYDGVARKGFVNGYCAVEMNGLWGYVNTKGKETVVPKYEMNSSDEYDVIFKSEDDMDMLVSPIDEATQKYYNVSSTDAEGIYYVNIENGEDSYLYGLATHFSQLIDCKYERGSTLSKDGKVYVGCSGNSYTIYTID